MPQLPTPFRAALGLVATAMDEARHLPDRAIELPMLAVSTALQMSLRAQQRYAHLAAKGDELLSRREVTDEPPEWARFDAPLSTDRFDPAGGLGAGMGGDMGDDMGRDIGEDVAGVTGGDIAGDLAGDIAGDMAGDPTADELPPKPRKTVRRPRNAKPSAFDAIGDE